MTRLQLIDEPDEAGRTTATLVASLSARLAVLPLMSGADAVGSLVAGMAQLGRAVARSAEGARLHAAVRAGRVGANGDALWRAFGIDRLAERTSASPVLAQLHNDVALLVADDLQETLALLPIPGEQTAATNSDDDAPTFADYVVGMWAFGREVVRAVEALAGEEEPAVRVHDGPPDDGRSLLR